MPPLEGLGYAFDPLDRASDAARRRGRDRGVARPSRRARSSSSRATCRSCARARRGLEPLLPLAEVEALGGARVEALLGLLPGRRAGVTPRSCPTTSVVEQADASDGFLDRRVLVVPGRDELEMVDIRSLAAGGLVPAPEASMLATAKSLLAWHARRSFCSNCGAKTVVGAGGLAARMPGLPHAALSPHRSRSSSCWRSTATTCLLGRQPRFPKGMYSALAGFLEPGETIEQAVRREIMEEAGIACGEVRYFASQPWPFPSSLMIGCFVEAESRTVTVDKVELEDARWFSRDEVRAMLEKRHPDGLARRSRWRSRII